MLHLQEMYSNDRVIVCYQMFSYNIYNYFKHVFFIINLQQQQDQTQNTYKTVSAPTSPCQVLILQRYCTTANKGNLLNICSPHHLISDRNLARLFLQVASHISSSDKTFRALCFTASAECLFSMHKCF